MKINVLSQRRYTIANEKSHNYWVGLAMKRTQTQNFTNAYSN